MTAHNSAPIQLDSQPHVFTIEDKQTLITVVDQLNIVTERLRALEDQIANGTLIVNPKPTGHLHLEQAPTPPTHIGQHSGWQPARR